MMFLIRNINILLILKMGQKQTLKRLAFPLYIN